MLHLIFVSLLIAAGLCFSIGGYFIIFWLRRMSWESLKGTVIDHEKSAASDDFCENSVIEVTTTDGIHRFTSSTASSPPTKLGTTVTVLKKPDANTFVEVSPTSVLLFTAGPLICGVAILWLTLNSQWQTGSGQPNRSASELQKSAKPVIRFIRFSGDDEYAGIELNGDRAYLHHSSSGTDKTEISYAEGLKLVEEFYAIPDIKRLLATKDQPKNNSTHHIVAIYDERPEYYSKDSVVYLIPKDTTDPQIRGWLEKMKRR